MSSSSALMRSNFPRYCICDGLFKDAMGFRQRNRGCICFLLGGVAETKLSHLFMPLSLKVEPFLRRASVDHQDPKLLPLKVCELTYEDLDPLLRNYT